MGKRIWKSIKSSSNANPKNNLINISNSKWIDYLEKENQKNKYFDKNIVENNTTKLLSVLDPNNSESIIAYGSVQSGKTNTMISSALNALSRDYDCVILLAGNLRILKKQTEKRFTKSIRNIDLDLEVLDLSNVNSGNSLRNIIKKTIITTLKSPNQMEDIEKNWKNFLSDKKVLIIDDECDYYSVNSSKTTTSTYDAIRGMIDFCKIAHYIGFTATPYANLNPKIENNINFKRTIILNESPGYTGLLEFKDNYEEFQGSIMATQTFERTLTDHHNRLLDSGLDNSIFLILQEHEKKKQRWSDFNIRKLVAKFNKKHNSNYRVRMLNQNENDEVIEDGHQIIIAYNLASRGVTFNNLITEVINREIASKEPADTLIQIARWFGYRNKYIKNIKILMNEKKINAFKELVKFDQSFRKVFAENTLHVNNEKLMELIDISQFEYIKMSNKSKTEKKK